MAIQGRWEQAARRYSALIKIDKLNGWGAVIMDYQAYGVVLAEGGDTDEYERFCQSAATNLFANALRNGVVKNGGILKTCLLFPVDKHKREMLRPMAESEARNWDLKSDPWACVPPALWKYRCGDYAGASSSCRLGLGQKNRYPAGDATLHGILAMCRLQSGQISEAEEELAQGRELVESQLSPNSEVERNF